MPDLNLTAAARATIHLVAQYDGKHTVAHDSNGDPVGLVDLITHSIWEALLGIEGVPLAEELGRYATAEKDVKAKVAPF